MSEERAASQDTAGRDPAPPGSGEAVRPGPARLPRGWRTYLVVCALAMVAGAAGTTAVRMLAGQAGGAASAIPSPPAANTAFVADDNGTGADNQANILRYTVRGLVHVLAGRGAGAGQASSSRRQGSCSPVARACAGPPRWWSVPCCPAARSPHG